MQTTADGVTYAEPGEVFGWYDWAPLYRRAVATAPPGAVLVELGVFFGRSLIDLGRLAAGRGLTAVGIDTWLGSPEFDGTVWANDRPVNEMPPGFVLGECYRNVALAGLTGAVKLIVSDSADAARLFPDGSVHLAFIDAGHDEASVARDIAAWLPKVAPGGIIAGHDYRPEDGFPGVKAAVDAAFGGRVQGIGSWWEVSL